MTQRVNQLLATGLLEERGFAPSNSGVAIREHCGFAATPVMRWLRIWAPGISVSDASTCGARSPFSRAKVVMSLMAQGSY